MKNKNEKSLASVLLATAYSICNSEDVIDCLWNGLNGCSVLDDILGVLNDCGFISDKELNSLIDSQCDRKMVIKLLDSAKFKMNIGQEYKWFVERSTGPWANKIETGFEYSSDAIDFIKELKADGIDTGAKIHNVKRVDADKLAAFMESLESL